MLVHPRAWGLCDYAQSLVASLRPPGHFMHLLMNTCHPLVVLSGMGAQWIEFGLSHPWVQVLTLLFTSQVGLGQVT